MFATLTCAVRSARCAARRTRPATHQAPRSAHLRSRRAPRTAHRALHVAVFCLLPTAYCLLPSAHAALISRSSEISLGREAAQEFERREPVDTDPVLAARVRRIGRRLVAATSATEYPFEFHAVDTNEINAFALPGGFIYVFRGLAQLVPGDDALAFILGHEISHVTQRHGIQQIEKSLALGTVLNFALHGSAAGGVLQLVLDMHYSRQDEAEADRLGLALMAKAGFDPTQGAEAMAIVARTAKAEKKIPPLLRSHPATESRIASLQRQAEALRAAPHPAPPVAATLPPLPAPPDPARPPSATTSSDLFPLAVGMEWTYRIAGSAERQVFTTEVIEQPPDTPGVFRLHTELDDDLAITRRVTVTADGVCACREAPSERAVKRSHESQAPGWQREIPLPAAAADQVVDWETVHVPAGEFRAARTTQLGPDGKPAATVWLAPGMGIVRRAWEGTGVVEELESFHRPAPEGDRSGEVK